MLKTVLPNSFCINFSTNVYRYKENRATDVNNTELRETLTLDLSQQTLQGKKKK